MISQNFIGFPFHMKYYKRLAVTGATLLLSAICLSLGVASKVWADTAPDAQRLRTTQQKAADSPIAMLQHTSNQLIAALKTQASSLKAHPEQAEQLAQHILLPQIDQVYMAQRTLGRDAWLKASPAQRDAFIVAFRTLVIRSYAGAFTSYTNEQVKFLPSHASHDHSLQTGRDQLTVDSRIIRRNGPPISISYQVARRNSGWKITDFSVEGISMLNSFSTQFAPTLDKQGIEMLIRQLQAHNAQNHPSRSR